MTEDIKWSWFAAQKKVRSKLIDELVDKYNRKSNGVSSVATAAFIHKVYLPDEIINDICKKIVYYKIQKFKLLKFKVGLLLNEDKTPKKEMHFDTDSFINHILKKYYKDALEIYRKWGVINIFF